MKLLSLLFSAMIAISAPAFANAPSTSLRPIQRPNETPGERVSLVKVYYTASRRPTARPVSKGGKPQLIAKAQPATPTNFAASRYAVVRSLRPTARPKTRPKKAAAPVVASAAVAAPKSIPTSKKGSICGSRSIRGQKMTAIPAKLKGCGLKKPVRVTSVGGVPLKRPATMECDTAKALEKWVEKGAKPAVGRLGGGLKEVNVIASYSCRTRNNIPGAKISEHGRGKAVDIGGVTLNNGVYVSVLKGWGTKVQGKMLSEMHSSACGIFGTVLGPKSDRHHRDHFHFDTASYRSGAYCR